MPTGYTAGVADGTISDFQTFALRCARAFGATILMRDDPMDAPIPDEFQPSSFYADALSAAKEKLANLKSLTSAEAEASRDAAHRESLASWERRVAERTETRNRYQEMLAQVVQWEPPTAEHLELKTFMVKQLRESIDFDCSDSYDERPNVTPVTEWLVQQTDRAARDVERYAAEHAKELERTASRNAWVKALRESLSAERAISK
jgi:hypothetical protein